MNATPSKEPDDRAPFVAPGMRPSPDRPSRLHVCVGVVCLVIGFIGIFLGGRDAVGQTLLIAGSIFVLTSLFAFRGFRFGAQRDREERDMRKLYGTPKV
jgi:drug/metabolite transporter (DMT)-like permease